MQPRKWTFCNVAADCYSEVAVVTPLDVGGRTSGYYIRKRRLHGGLRDGVDVVEVDNGLLRFVVVPTRGMGLWCAYLNEMRIGWNAPVKGPVHPSFVPLYEPSGIGWLDGFDELLVRCGLESNGAPEFNPNGTLRYPLHGKIANIPAHLVEAEVDGETGTITIMGQVDETRLFFQKLRLTARYVTRVNEPRLTVIDEVENISAEPAELELLYHVNFGAPVLRPRSTVVLPVRRLCPRDETAVGTLSQWDSYGPETPGVRESVFFAQLYSDDAGNTRAVLQDPEQQRGVSLLFNVNQLPYFTLWKNPQAAIDGYVTGLEPGTNYPNCKSFEKEQGRVITLQPGEKRCFEVTLEVHATAESLQQAKQHVEQIRNGRPAEILPQPDPNWAKVG